MVRYYCMNCGEIFTDVLHSLNSYCPIQTNSKTQIPHELVKGDDYQWTGSNDFTLKLYEENLRIKNNKIIISKKLKELLDITKVNNQFELTEKVVRFMLKKNGLEHYDVQWSNKPNSGFDDEAIYIKPFDVMLMNIDFNYRHFFHCINYIKENEKSIKEENSFIRNFINHKTLKQISEKLKDNIWIGTNYKKRRVLILGESIVYWGCSNRTPDSPNIPQDLIKPAIIKEIPWKIKRDDFIAKITKTILNDDTPTNTDIVDFWKSTTFMNIIQRQLPAEHEVILNKDYVYGWRSVFHVVKMTKPRTILKFGMEGMDQLPDFLSRYKQVWKYNMDEFSQNPRIINLEKGDYKLKIICINHPNRSIDFDSQYWSKIIQENAPDLFTTS